MAGAGHAERHAGARRARWATGSRRRSSRARKVDGKDSYIAVVPDKDCIVNKGDHSPRGGTNALTVYTTRKHPLTNPTERNLYPQVRDARGGPLRRVSWDAALDRVADAIKRALDGRGPVVDRAVGRPTISRRR